MILSPGCHKLYIFNMFSLTAHSIQPVSYTHLDVYKRQLVNCSFTMMDSYMSAGILEPLNKYTDEWDEWGDFTKEYVDMFTKDGNVYGIPNLVAPMLFAYNKTLFEEAGIKAEDIVTWDDFIEAGKVLKDKTGVDMLCMAESRNDATYRSMLMQLGNCLLYTSRCV